VRYQLRDGQLGPLFDGLADTAEGAKVEFFRALRERIPTLFGSSSSAVDPNDATNEKAVEGSALRSLCTSGFVGAQRGLDDATQKDRVVIGKVLENLFSTAKANAADVESRTVTTSGLTDICLRGCAGHFDRPDLHRHSLERGTLEASAARSGRVSGGRGTRWQEVCTTPTRRSVSTRWHWNLASCPRRIESGFS
jgi:hypothetical protein